MWGRAEGSHQVSEEIQTNTFHWKKGCCCCYGAPHLENKIQHTNDYKKTECDTEWYYLTNPTYQCHSQWASPLNHLNYLPLWALEHIWPADFSVRKHCVCSGPSIGTLWTAHAPVFWWVFLHWTTSVFVNGYKGTGGARRGRKTLDKRDFVNSCH